MLEKSPKSQWKSYLKKGAITLIAAETIFLAGSYFVWTRLNQERDFRLYMHKNYPWVLEGFYSVGETVNSELRIRQFDEQIWKQEGKLDN